MWYRTERMFAMAGEELAVRIDCNDCAMQHTAACDDCIVTAMLDRRDEAVVFSLDEARAIKALQRGGLAPQNRFLPINRAASR